MAKRAKKVAKKVNYAVAFTFGGVVIVEATDPEDAESQVEAMTNDRLMEIAEDGFQILSVEVAED